MRVVLLSWDAGAGDGGLSRQAAVLAGGLRRRGVDVLVVTREGERPHRPVDAERLVLPDSPAVMQDEVRGRLPEALAVANRMVARLVAGRHEDDVLVVEGWQAALAALPAAAVDRVPVVAVLDGLEGIRCRLGDDPDQDGNRVQAIERELAATAATVLWRGPAPPDTAAAVLQVPVPAVEVLTLAVEVPEQPVRHRMAGPRLVAVLPPRGAPGTWLDRFGAGLQGHEVRDLRHHQWPVDRPPDVLVVHDVERGDVAVHALAAGIPLVVGTIGGLPGLVDPSAVGRIAGADAGSAAEVAATLLDDDDARAALAEAGRRHARDHHDLDVALDVVIGAAKQALAG